MWHKPCRTFNPWCLCIKTRCLCNCLMLSGYRPIPEPILTYLHDAISRPWWAKQNCWARDCKIQMCLYRAPSIYHGKCTLTNWQKWSRNHKLTGGVFFNWKEAQFFVGGCLHTSLYYIVNCTAIYWESNFADNNAYNHMILFARRPRTGEMESSGKSRISSQMANVLILNGTLRLTWNCLL